MGEGRAAMAASTALVSRVRGRDERTRWRWAMAVTSKDAGWCNARREWRGMHGEARSGAAGMKQA
ncbi:hypothetical protein C7E25_22475, partial [Stenotrophomonas maltophilia]